VNAPRCIDCDASATHDAQPSRGTPEGRQGPKCDRHAGPARTVSGLPVPRCTSAEAGTSDEATEGIVMNDFVISADTLAEFAATNNALERAIPESWDGEESWSWIAERWIEHMATTHGAHCAGRYCPARADMPRHVAALRRMWRDSERYSTLPNHPATGGYRDAVRDLANELGVDLDA